MTPLAGVSRHPFVEACLLMAGVVALRWYADPILGSIWRFTPLTLVGAVAALRCGLWPTLLAAAGGIVATNIVYFDGSPLPRTVTEWASFLAHAWTLALLTCCISNYRRNTQDLNQEVTKHAGVSSGLYRHDRSSQQIAASAMCPEPTSMESPTHAPMKTEESSLLRHLFEAQEQEKQTLCHEFHDGIIQYAVGACMVLESYRHRVGRDCGDEIQAAIEFLNRGIADGRRTIRGIRPAELDDLGLVAAVEETARNVVKSEMEVVVEADDGVDALPKISQTVAYRIVQESLNNARKHSGAKTAWVKLSVSQGFLTVSIRDLGRGFDTNTHHDGFGLIGMIHRARLVGGVLTIKSTPEDGTVVTATLPIAAQNDDDERVDFNAVSTAMHDVHGGEYE
jgi:signal transduction histidine kinase